MEPPSPRLGSLPREDRALAVVACALAGRRAAGLCELLPPDRGERIRTALEALLAIPAAERAAALAREAARLATPARLDPASVHPERLRRLLASESPEGRRLLESLLGTGVSPGEGRPHRAALEVAQAWLGAALATPPWPDEVQAAPEPVRALLRASAPRLRAVAAALGPARARAAFDAAPPAVSAWLRQRLPPEFDAQLEAEPPADTAASLAALAELTVLGDNP